MFENTLTIDCIDDIVTLGNNIIEDKRVIGGTALTALEKVVEDTSYSIGTVESFENNNINFYFTSSLAGLNDIIDTYGCEFKTRIVINDLGKIQAKYIDLVHRLGSDTGLRFTYDTNVNSIERTTSDDGHFNVLYGRGSSLETEDGGYSRKLTFEDVVWTTPNNPINKPLGLKYIEDTESIKKYGRLEGIYENDKIKDPKELLQTTFEKLQKVKDLNYSYVVDAEDLRNFEGFEHYKYTFGDSIIVLDEDENITVEARILGINKEVDLDNNTKQTKITLGNYRNGLIENEDDIKDVIDNIKDQLGNIGDSEINDSEFPDTLPDAPNITGKGLFATIMLEWTYENKMYYTYELFASKIKDFAPGPTNRIFEGKASAFLHEVNPEETWYYRARAKNTHEHYTEYSTQLTVSTYKISDSQNYFEKAAIKDASIGELKLDRGWVGKLIGTYIDAKNLSVTDGNGKRTLNVDSFGNVDLNVNTLQIQGNNVAQTEWVKSEISSASNTILLEAGKKIGKDEVISYINLSPEEIKIASDKITLDGNALLSGTLKMVKNNDSNKFAMLQAVPNDTGVNMLVVLGGESDACSFEVCNKDYTRRYFWTNHQGTSIMNDLWLYSEDERGDDKTSCKWSYGSFYPTNNDKGYLGLPSAYWNTAFVSNMNTKSFKNVGSGTISENLTVGGNVGSKTATSQSFYSTGWIEAVGEVKGQTFTCKGNESIAGSLSVGGTTSLNGYTVIRNNSLGVERDITCNGGLTVGGTTIINGYTVIKNNSLGVEDSVYINGDIELPYGTVRARNLAISGSKNCVQQTASYGERLINAYETCDYLFGDLGESNIESGECIVWVDNIFKEIISSEINYQVFLTKYGPGDIWVSERNTDFFVVKGTNDIAFGWEIKGKRKGYENHRLVEYIEEEKNNVQEDNTI